MAKNIFYRFPQKLNASTVKVVMYTTDCSPQLFVTMWHVLESGLMVIKKHTSCAVNINLFHSIRSYLHFPLSYLSFEFIISPMWTHRCCLLQAFETVTFWCNKASTEKLMRNLLQVWLNTINPLTDEVPVPRCHTMEKKKKKKNIPFALSSRNGGCLLC